MRGPECPLWIDFVVKVGDFDAGPWRRLLKWSSSFPVGRWGVRSMEADVRHCYARRVSIAGADEERAWQAGEDSVRWRRAYPLGPWATPGTAAHGGGTPQ